MALFLQDKLSLLRVDDPFAIKDSKEVVKFLSRHSMKSLDALSIDIKNLYYHLPQQDVLKCTDASIDWLGSIVFQNAVGVPVTSFLELISFYLRSTYAE